MKVHVWYDYVSNTDHFDKEQQSTCSTFCSLLHEHESNKSLQYNDNKPSNPVHLHQAKLADQLFKCKYRIKKINNII